MSDLHFLRPFWLVLLLVLPLLPAVVRQARQSQNGWSRIIPAALLRPLVRPGGATQSPSRLTAMPLVLAWTLMSLALAGPAWREAPTPLQQQNDSLVIALNLSLSMLATDVSPDRLTLAKRKIRDLLTEREGSFTALVAYAGDAHVVTPLTDDRRTMEGLLSSLEPMIMPVTGNRADLAVARAHELLDQGARGKGRILLITDDIRAKHRYDIRALLENSPYPLSAIVVGTEAGGPIPLADKGFIRENGEIVTVRANFEALAQLTQKTGGASHSVTVDSRDLTALDLRAGDDADWARTERDLSVDRWQDDGYWLLWLALPLLLFSWRRGALMVTVLILVPTLPTPAMAFEWADLWSRPEQRGDALIERDPEQAVAKFEDPAWRGSALYRAGDYEAAIEAFAAAEQSNGRYNLGNALARAGKLEESLEAYDKVLEDNPDHDDARHNRELVAELLKQQEQQEQQEQEEQEQKDNQDKSGESEDQEQDGSENPQQQDDSEGASQPDDGNSSQPPEDRDDNGGESQETEEENEPDAQNAEQKQKDGERAQEREEQKGVPEESEENPLSQGQEQWLRRIPDDPGGLLRRKFQQQYRERNTPSDESDTPW
ncbi:MAG: VWA domain-containing protein [Oleiphilaceae bacterium]|nr:VWA domain-containing protein [Oleiphilaceae bacterium]